MQQLHFLGYKQDTYCDTDLFEDFLECGKYAFTTTVEGDDDEEREVEVIEIQHFPEKSFVKKTEFGLIFIGDCMSKATRIFATNQFGFELDLIHSICMFEGTNCRDDIRQF